MVALKGKEAYLSIKVVELLKRNGKPWYVV